MTKLRKAVSEVEKHLVKHAPNGASVKVYTYNDIDARSKSTRRWAGVMVAEVTFFNANGGSSFMQVDVPWGIAVCGQAERAILAHIEDWPEDEKKEELDRLSLCFTSS